MLKSAGSLFDNCQKNTWKIHNIMLRAKDTCMDLKDVHNSNKDLKHEAQISDILYTVESSDRPKFGAYVQRVSLQLDAIIQDIICDTLLSLDTRQSEFFFEINAWV
jgi:hypothetical protein